MNQRGLHSRLSVSVCENCPLASLSNEAQIRDLTSTRSGGPLQFLINCPVGDCAQDCEFSCDLSDIEMITLDEQAVGRISDPTCDQGVGDCDCGCLLAGLEVLPIDPMRMDVEDGVVHMEFTLQDRAELRTIVSRFRECSLDVSLESIALGGTERDSGATTVALSELTERQREVVSTAVAMGYYDADGATAAEVAEALDIAKPTLSEHLSAATKSVFGQLFSRSTATHESPPSEETDSGGVDDVEDRSLKKQLPPTNAD